MLLSFQDIIQTEWGKNFAYCERGHGGEGTGEFRGQEYVDLRLNSRICIQKRRIFNPLKPELNPICYLLVLLAHHFLHVSRIRVKSLTLR